MVTDANLSRKTSITASLSEKMINNAKRIKTRWPSASDTTKRSCKEKNNSGKKKYFRKNVNQYDTTITPTASSRSTTSAVSNALVDSPKEVLKTVVEFFWTQICQDSNPSLTHSRSLFEKNSLFQKSNSFLAFDDAVDEETDYKKTKEPGVTACNEEFSECRDSAKKNIIRNNKATSRSSLSNPNQKLFSRARPVVVHPTQPPRHRLNSFSLNHLPIEKPPKKSFDVRSLSISLEDASYNKLNTQNFVDEKPTLPNVQTKSTSRKIMQRDAGSNKRVELEPKFEHDSSIAQHQFASILPKSQAFNPREYIRKGIEAHQSNDLAFSAICFERCAKENGGCGTGMILWALSLRHGWGCEVDRNKAFGWLLLALQCLLRRLHQLKLERQDYMKNSAVDKESNNLVSPVAAKHLRKRVKLEKEVLGTTSELLLTLYELGQCLMHGWGCRKDKKAAVDYYKVAAILGDEDAQKGKDSPTLMYWIRPGNQKKLQKRCKVLQNGMRSRLQHDGLSMDLEKEVRLKANNNFNVNLYLFAFGIISLLEASKI
ncbi:hypothetical protein O181_053183 [Austropuccinia psidii MF-1]|uniref:Protein DSF2 n=1 Tax=Austropuccinia psidii MF-1 TaxID=1389203 RepID=A0A9Q3E3Z6_9BASI|nr:hypothetical protein [Austropuccinia psidii MF-1]